MTEPIISVGLVEGPEATLCFSGKWEGAANGDCVTFSAETLEGPRVFTPLAPDARFTVKGMRYGIGFHWDRNEDMTFEGAVEVVDAGKGKIAVINKVGLETYLKSVISSEMSGTSMPELLKAHAVMSRTWLLRNMRDYKPCADSIPITCLRPLKPHPSIEEHIVWYDRSAHTLYDVCADDHCQRYQGVGRITPAAEAAVEATRGIIMIDEDGDYVDARFSKCCGGITEEFNSCWQDHTMPGLESVYDTPNNNYEFVDFRDEKQARRWILSEPEAWCNTRNREVLAQVMNGYDLETTDFYRWRVDYTADELADLLRRRSGIDFGRIKNLSPMVRGKSGRIVKLIIEGEKRSIVVGKELEIRKWLSESHLYSSAFVAIPWEECDADGFPAGWTLRGAGWGHGVGLCQIGAAMMAHAGYGYKDILCHYYGRSSICIC